MSDVEALIEALAKEGAPARRGINPYTLSIKWLAAAAAYLALSLMLTGLRPDLMLKLHSPLFDAELMLLVGVMAATSLSGALLSFPDLHQQRRTVFAPLWMFALFLSVMVFAWRADAPPAPLPVYSFECTLNILLFSLLPSAAIFYAMRGLASTHPRLSGVVAVLFTFSTGALWLRLHEMNDSTSHVIIWHYLPLLAVGALGVWLGKIFLRW